MKNMFITTALALATLPMLKGGIKFNLDIDENAGVPPEVQAEAQDAEGVAPVAPSVPAEAPVAPVAPEAPVETIKLKGVAVKLRKGSVTKGKNKGNPDYQIVLPVAVEGLELFAQIVGLENLLRHVFKHVNQAVREAANESFELVDGKPTFQVTKFETLIVDAFNPDRSRKSGPSKAELQELMNELINNELLPLVTKQGAGTITDDEKIQLASIVDQIGQLQAKIDKKTRPVKAAK